MSRLRATLPSRHGKKQVIAYLNPDQAAAAYAKADRDHKTNQELVGEAINAELAALGQPALIPAGHQRLFRRTATRRASARTPAQTPRCRVGRIAYGGWFDRDTVSQVRRIAAGHRLTIQLLIEHGLARITAPR